MIEPSLFARLGFTIGLGIIIVLIPFVKTGSDSRVAKWRRDGSWWNWATNEDGSLRHHTKLVLAAILISIVIGAWLVPDKYIGIRSFDGGFQTSADQK